ncbi:recombination protein F [Helicobacter mustelae]|uniref:ATP-binding protein n=1 Tax=Helicobacter mustelae TaxID=217 RepID=UPI000DFC617A|nr:ATP-binding protein [Helicobacter mustelae]STP14180.1 recombination protein F [Helicobacter mustelae]
MKIVQVKIKNFRSYKNEILIDFDNLTAFVGKNDIGKSTILEALDIFFDGGVIKLDKSDINCQSEDDKETIISVVFEGFPEELVIDSTNPTTLKSEFLLNQNEKLEIIKKYNDAAKPKIFLKAYHPSNAECSDLHSKKINDLQKIVKSGNIVCDNQAKSAELRKAIWNHYSQDLQLEEKEIELSKEDGKNIWEQLEKSLPHYALFQSDRSNSDGDSEVQNPLKSAVAQIFKDDKLSSELEEIAKAVKKKLEEITEATLQKIRETNEEIASNLKAQIPEINQLKWADVFKNVSIMGDENIPINKRGSGVKRLILLSFFRAEAERRQRESNNKNLIYAIEEPETSQHQEHQRMIIEALKKISNSGIQIIFTTHSPTIVKELKFENLRVIKSNNDKKEIIRIQEATLPIPSLNEVNFLAFEEADEEYHNELYGYIDSCGLRKDYVDSKPKRDYKKITKNNSIKLEQITTTEYIRHQIHHPENEENPKYTKEELLQSIQDMRDFIKNNKQKDKSE